MKWSLKVGLIVLAFLLFAIQGVAAQEVSRELPSSVNTGATFNVTLNAPTSAFGMEVVETIPSGFSYVSHTSTGAESVDFSQSGNNLTFTVTDMTTGDGFTITYTLTATDTADTYTFSGTYQPMGQSVSEISGDTSVSVGVCTPNERLVRSYYTEYDCAGDLTQGGVVKAVTNAVTDYFTTKDPDKKQEIVNDVTQLVQLYFKL